MSEEEQPKKQEEPAATENKDASGNSNITLVVMIVCIIIASLSLIFYFKKDKGGGPGGSNGTVNGPDSTGNLVDGKEYLVYLKTVEVQPQKNDGKAWDPGNSAPDVFYRVMWKNNKIYESETMKDSLIAEWVPVGFSLKDSILSGEVTVDQAVKIARVRVDSKIPQSDEVIIKILDNDLLSGNDPIHDLRIYLSKLNEGDNIFDYRDKQGHGLIKAVVRVVDNGLSTDEKVQALMKGQ